MPKLLTKQQFKDLLEFQGYICPICRKDLNIILSKGLGKLALDHDHVTGEVRGVLHKDCNLLLGFARDSVEYLEYAIKYLTSPPARAYFERDLIDFDQLPEENF